MPSTRDSKPDKQKEWVWPNKWLWKKKWKGLKANKEKSSNKKEPMRNLLVKEVSQPSKRDKLLSDNEMPFKPQTTSSTTPTTSETWSTNIKASFPRTDYSTTTQPQPSSTLKDCNSQTEHHSSPKRIFPNPWSAWEPLMKPNKFTLISGRITNFSNPKAIIFMSWSIMWDKTGPKESKNTPTQGLWRKSIKSNKARTSKRKWPGWMLLWPHLVSNSNPTLMKTANKSSSKSQNSTTSTLWIDWL